MSASRWRLSGAVAAVVGLGSVLGACGGDDDTGTITEAAMPTPVMSEAEIQQLWDEATAFADQSITAWPDVDAFTANDADDIRGADPTASDYCCKGKDALYSYWQQWAEISDYTINVEGMYVSANGAAYEETWPGFWPTDFGVSVPGPRDPAGPSALEVYRFRDGQVIWGEVWYLPDDNELFGLGCFAVDGCPALQNTVDQYVAAWSSRDPDAVAALYSDNADFTDSMLGLEVQGADAIGDLAAVRFGSAGDLNIEVLGLYAWTDGRYPPTETNPEQGRLVGVAIHYRASVEGNDAAGVQEAITTLHLGTLLENSFDPDPQGLIHSEDLFHEPASLLAALQS